MRYLIVGGLLLGASSAFAAGEDCIKVENDLDRLACYDQALGRTATATNLSVGRWQVREERSKLTDKPEVVMHVPSEETINCGWNNGDKVYLMVGCKDDRTVVVFNTGCHMASSEYSNYGQIEYRIDQEKAQKVNGEASTDNRTLGIWRGSKSIPIVKQMLGKSTMIARMTPYGENPFTATFNISGLEEAIKPLRAACKW